MAEGGLPATQQFVLEDVPREIQKLGNADRVLLDQLRHAGAADQVGARRTAATSPSSAARARRHGYPGALGIAIPPDKAGDMAFINAENKRVIAEHKMTGHFGTWVAPESMVAIRAGDRPAGRRRREEGGLQGPGGSAEVPGGGRGRAGQDRQYDEQGGNHYLSCSTHQVY